VTAELSVVLPCRNERANLAPLLARLEAALEGVAWEAIIVDDDSPDLTWTAAKAIAARDPRVRVLRRVGRRGLASAVVEGWMASSAPFVAVMDADLQHDEALLPRMLAALREGQAGVVIGSRHVEGGTVGEGLSSARRGLSDLGATMANALLPRRISDPMSGFFMLERTLAEAVAPKLSAQGFKILLDLLLVLPRDTRVLELPYTFRPRHAGESKLDAQVMMDFLGLLADRTVGRWVPLRFLSFAAVGAVGVLVHLAVLWLDLRLFGAGFEAAQWTATLVAMTGNFFLNNAVTYRDVRLRGAALWRGLVLFYVVCGIGAFANVGIARVLYEDALAWGLAGAAGAILSVVWNYAVSATLVWRTR
jgi:dolichol-phosphate mannosyltransferase